MTKKNKKNDALSLLEKFHESEMKEEKKKNSDMNDSVYETLHAYIQKNVSQLYDYFFGFVPITYYAYSQELKKFSSKEWKKDMFGEPSGRIPNCCKYTYDVVDGIACVNAWAIIGAQAICFYDVDNEGLYEYFMLFELEDGISVPFTKTFNTYKEAENESEKQLKLYFEAKKKIYDRVLDNLRSHVELVLCREESMLKLPPWKQIDYDELRKKIEEEMVEELDYFDIDFE
jgi:hypothetical protein